MLDDIVIVGIVLSVTQLFKMPLRRRLGRDLCRKLTPLLVLFLAAGLSAINVQVFGMGQIQIVNAVAHGITLGAISGGIYSMGRAALGMG